MEAIVLTLKDRHVLMNGDSTLSVDPQGWTAGLCEEFDTFFITVGETTYRTRPMTDMEDTLYGYDPVSQYLEFLIEETTKAVAPGSLAASLKQQLNQYHRLALIECMFDSQLAVAPDSLTGYL